MARVKITAIGVSPRGGKGLARKAGKTLAGVGNRMASVGKTLQSATSAPMMPSMRGKKR